MLKIKQKDTNTQNLSRSYIIGYHKNKSTKNKGYFIDKVMVTMTKKDRKYIFIDIPKLKLWLVNGAHLSKRMQFYMNKCNISLFI